MHVHHLQEEALTVQQGRIAYQRRGEPEQFAEPGETVTFKPGDPVHRLVFPVQVALGRLLGKYEKYADAPEPVRPE